MHPAQKRGFGWETPRSSVTRRGKRIWRPGFWYWLGISDRSGGSVGDGEGWLRLDRPLVLLCACGDRGAKKHDCNSHTVRRIARGERNSVNPLTSGYPNSVGEPTRNHADRQLLSVSWSRDLSARMLPLIYLDTYMLCGVC